ncbi:MAG: hypothetical protein V5A57_03185, partial [Candidatus Paceibacterota bacterium]
MLNLRQKLVFLILTTAIIFAGTLGFVGQAEADYYATSTLTSTDLLSGETASSVDGFVADVLSLPSGTAVKVQFSQDQTNWYNASGSADSWDSLSSGSNSIDLSGLGWSGSEFYYKMKFESNTDQSATPKVGRVAVNTISSISPSDGSTGLCGDATLEVDVSDIDG